VLSRRSLFSLAAAAVVSCRRKRGAGFPGFAFVANEEGQAVAVVDLTAFAVVRHIRLEGNPALVVTHAAREAVYALTPRTGTVHEISTTRLAVRRKMRAGPSAVSMRMEPDGGALWVLCAETRQLVRVPLERFQPETRIALPGTPVDFDLSRGEDRIAVSLGAEAAVALVDLRRRTVRRITIDGAKPGLVRFRKDGRVLLVGDRQRRLLSIVETASGRIQSQLPLAVTPEHLCFKNDEGQMFLAGPGMDAVVTVYPYQTQVGGTTLAGRAPGFLAASSSPDYLFVANPQSGDVTIVDIQTQRVIAVARVGKEPCHITFTPDNQYALVLNRGSGDMAVIRMAAVIARRTKSAPLFTMIPVGSRPVSAVVRAV